MISPLHLRTQRQRDGDGEPSAPESYRVLFNDKHIGTVVCKHGAQTTIYQVWSAENDAESSGKASFSYETSNPDSMEIAQLEVYRFLLDRYLSETSQQCP